MEYTYLLELADECEDPHMRLVYAGNTWILAPKFIWIRCLKHDNLNKWLYLFFAACWFISVYPAIQRTWKPFNPILGETYELVNHGGITFIAEQVIFNLFM